MTEVLMSIIILISATGHMAVTGKLSSTMHSVHPLLSAIPSAGLGSFPGRVTHSFIPGGSVLFVIMSELAGYSFPLTTQEMVGHRDTWKDLLHSRHNFS